jgi:hypothetical protein
MFRGQKTLNEQKNTILQYTDPSSFVVRLWKLEHCGKKRKKNNSSGDEVYEDTLGQFIKQIHRLQRR